MKTNEFNRYPVSESICCECSNCYLVTETIGGYHLSKDEQYYQCIADMAYECAEANLYIDDWSFMD